MTLEEAQREARKLLHGGLLPLPAIRDLLTALCDVPTDTSKDVAYVSFTRAQACEYIKDICVRNGVIVGATGKEPSQPQSLVRVMAQLERFLGDQEPQP